MAPSALILVVDDDPEVADVVASLLTIAGHTVAVVPGGKAALEALARQRYELISALSMADIDGLALYGHVAGKYPSLSRRFIFLSSEVSLPAMRGLFEAIGAPALGRPFDAAVLQRTVNAVLARAAACSESADGVPEPPTQEVRTRSRRMESGADRALPDRINLQTGSI